jgi:hypothetical protein
VLQFGDIAAITYTKSVAEERHERWRAKREERRKRRRRVNPHFS